jgi:hypothetical protein
LWTRNLRCGGASCARLESQTLHQTRGDHFGRVDHAFALKPDLAFRATDVVAREFGSVAEPQDIPSGKT